MESLNLWVIKDKSEGNTVLWVPADETPAQLLPKVLNLCQVLNIAYNEE